MGLAELTQGKKFKNFMAKLYGWGASIVIVGALFKIQHWPFSGFFLVLGLGTEAVIFFFSGTHKDYHRPTDDFNRITPSVFISATELARAGFQALDRSLDR